MRKEGEKTADGEMDVTVLAVSLLTQNLHCLLVCTRPFSLSPPASLYSSTVLLFHLIHPQLLLLLSLSPFFFSAANKKQQPLDADVFHLVPPHCQLFCAQHVRGRGGGELSQVSPAAGGGGGAAERGETTKAIGEKAEK